MTESDLRITLATSNLSTCEKALILLWSESAVHGGGLTPYGISKKMTALRVGNPNRAQLEKDLNKSPDVIKVSGRYQIKAGRIDQIRKLVGKRTEDPIVDLTGAYLPPELWRGTRGYIEKVALQLCGCWEECFYDAVAVLLRRLSETLLIEAYERQGRQSEICDPNGNYLPLGSIVDRACGPGGLNLGREAKNALKEIKECGDRSAHNRRINAVRSELERLRPGSRTVVEELINIARFKD